MSGAKFFEIVNIFFKKFILSALESGSHFHERNFCVIDLDPNDIRNEGCNENCLFIFIFLNSHYLYKLFSNTHEVLIKFWKSWLSMIIENKNRLYHLIKVLFIHLYSKNLNNSQALQLCFMVRNKNI